MTVAPASPVAGATPLAVPSLRAMTRLRPNGLLTIVVLERGIERLLCTTLPPDAPAPVGDPALGELLDEWATWTRLLAARVQAGQPLHRPIPVTSTVRPPLQVPNARPPRGVPPAGLPEVITGDWLRRRRKTLGLSQRELAARAGVSRGSVATAERPAPRLHRPTPGVSAHVLRQLAQALGRGPISAEAAAAREEVTDGR